MRGMEILLFVPFHRASGSRVSAYGAWNAFAQHGITDGSARSCEAGSWGVENGHGLTFVGMLVILARKSSQVTFVKLGVLGEGESCLTEEGKEKKRKPAKKMRNLAPATHTYMIYKGKEVGAGGCYRCIFFSLVDLT